MEMVVYSERIRTLNYEPLLDDWQVITIPLQGNILSENRIVVNETQPILNLDHNHVPIDWIVLK